MTKPKKRAGEELPSDVVEWQKKQVQRGLQDADQGRFASQEKVKRTIRKFALPLEARFSDRPGGYIYRRYQLTGDPEPSESFFPITAGEDGYRTPWIDEYCRSGQRLADAVSDCPTAPAPRQAR